jgi:hypothetical protein
MAPTLLLDPLSLSSAVSVGEGALEELVSVELGVDESDVGSALDEVGVGVGLADDDVEGTIELDDEGAAELELGPIDDPVTEILFDAPEEAAPDPLAEADVDSSDEVESQKNQQTAASVL